MLHEEHLQAIGPRVKLTCRECRQATVGQVLRRERRPYYFGIPLGVERQVLVRCGSCGIEYFASSLPLDTVELSDVDHFLGKVNSPLFPKILIALMLISCPLPGVPFLIHFFLRGYREYIRGPWKKLHKAVFWLAVAAHLILWLPMLVMDLLATKR
jgi:hypothetical protein